MKLILGIDPGTAVTGWGVIGSRGNKLRAIAHGTIKTSARDPAHERLNIIYRELLEVIDTHQPQEAAIEELFGGANLKAALAVGQSRGVAILACAERGLKPADYTALNIKQAVVGYGRASKAQMQEMVKVLLGLPKIPRPDHAADALGVAICHAHTRGSGYGLAAAEQTATIRNPTTRHTDYRKVSAPPANAGQPAAPGANIRFKAKP